MVKRRCVYYLSEAVYAELEAIFANTTTYPPFPETEGGGSGGRCIDQVGGIHVEIGFRLPYGIWLSIM